MPYAMSNCSSPLEYKYSREEHIPFFSRKVICMDTHYNHIPHTPLAMFLSVGLLLLMAGTAAAQSTTPTHVTVPAHAKVYKAIPAIGSTITQAPTTVTVFALENINPNPKLSNLFVYAPTGELISQGNAQVSLQDPKQMSITIKPNGNGVYIVRWITVSALDGDPDQGAFFFNVQPKAPAKATAPTKTTAWRSSLTARRNIHARTPLFLVPISMLLCQCADLRRHYACFCTWHLAGADQAAIASRWVHYSRIAPDRSTRPPDRGGPDCVECQDDQHGDDHPREPCQSSRAGHLHCPTASLHGRTMEDYRDGAGQRFRSPPAGPTGPGCVNGRDALKHRWHSSKTPSRA